MKCGQSFRTVRNQPWRASIWRTRSSEYSAASKARSERCCDVPGAAGNPKEWVASYKCLKEKYGAPPHILQGFRDGDLPVALSFLRQKAHIYLTFVS